MQWFVCLNHTGRLKCHDVICAGAPLPPALQLSKEPALVDRTGETGGVCNGNKSVSFSLLLILFLGGHPKIYFDS